MKDWLVVGGISLIVNICATYAILLNSMSRHLIDDKLNKSRCKTIHISGIIAFASAIIALFVVQVLIERC